MPVITKEFALNMKGDDEIRDTTKKMSDTLSEIDMDDGVITISVCSSVKLPSPEYNLALYVKSSY